MMLFLCSFYLTSIYDHSVFEVRHLHGVSLLFSGHVNFGSMGDVTSLAISTLDPCHCFHVLLNFPFLLSQNEIQEESWVVLMPGLDVSDFEPY